MWPASHIFGISWFDSAGPHRTWRLVGSVGFPEPMASTAGLRSIRTGREARLTSNCNFPPRGVKKPRWPDHDLPAPDRCQRPGSPVPAAIPFPGRQSRLNRFTGLLGPDRVGVREPQMSIRIVAQEAAENHLSNSDMLYLCSVSLRHPPACRTTDNDWVDEPTHQKEGQVKSPWIDASSTVILRVPQWPSGGVTRLTRRSHPRSDREPTTPSVALVSKHAVTALASSTETIGNKHLVLLHWLCFVPATSSCLSTAPPVGNGVVRKPSLSHAPLGDDLEGRPPRHLPGQLFSRTVVGLRGSHSDCPASAASPRLGSFDTGLSSRNRR